MFFLRLKGDTFLAGGSPLPSLKVLPNNTLWIQSMDHHLSGIYSCVAVSPETDTITTKAYVLVKNTAHEDDTCGIGRLKKMVIQTQLFSLDADE